MKRLLVFLSVLFFIINIDYKKIKASESVDIQVIYSDLIVDENDTIKILINLSDVRYYQSIQVIIDLGDSFELIDETPCQLITNSYFNQNEVYVNTLEDNVIKFVGFKNSLMVNSNFNNICEINLKVLKNSENVDTLFNTFKISLFDEEYEPINTILYKSEGLKYNWNIDEYEVLVFDEFPDFLEDISIINRNKDEYSIRIQKEGLNNQKIGHQILNVYIYDFINEQTLFLSKNVRVIDNTPPSINGKDNLVINDFELKKELFHIYEIVDNYDSSLEIIYMYYDKNMNEISNFELFYEYLKYNTLGYIKVIAIDSSGNQSEEFIQEIIITDTTPPIIKYEEVIEVKDVDLEMFDIYQELLISDSYDSKPIVFITTGLDFKEKIQCSFEEKISFYGVDNLGNKTPSKEVKIKLIDTTSPTLEKVTDLEVNDIEFIDLKTNLLSCFTFHDNLSKELQYSYIYLDEEKELSFEEFNDLLFHGKTLYINLTGIDSFNNYSNTINILVKLNDTTSPTINIKNIENDKKYLSINKLDYEVKDNFLNELNVSIYLNDKLYEGTPITNPGKYVLKIFVEDGNKNKTEETVNFEIIKNNLIGCGLDSDCYEENYQVVIYIALGILGVAFVIVTVKLILNKQKKTKE